MGKYLDATGLEYFYNLIKSKFAPASHNHSIGDITTGVLPIASGGTGATTANDACNNIGAVKYKNSSISDGTVINGGSEWTNGAGLFLAGKENETIGIKGGFALHAQSDAGESQLLGSPAGVLSWNNKALESIIAIGDGYIRYDSGLQICWGTPALFNKTTTIIYPLPFIGQPSASVTMRNSGIYNQLHFLHCNSDATSLYIIGDDDNLYCHYITVGRWK